MDWTDCPVIEVVPGKMSGAPVLRHSRVRPQDLLTNLDEGPEWMADAFGLSIDDVRQVAWCRDQGYGRTDPNPAWGQATRT